MATFLIADTHFGHANILKYEGRPWDDIRDHDEGLIARWNEIVCPTDTVWHLGDVAVVTMSAEIRASGISANEAQSKHIRSILPRLNGTKYLVGGNHDKGRSNGWWRSAGFVEVWKYHKNFEGVEINGVLLSHKPLIDARKQNIHGHLHSGASDHRGPLLNPYSHQCVSVEQIDFRPILWQDVIRKFH